MYSFRAHVGGGGSNMWVWPAGSGVQFKAMAWHRGVWFRAVGLAYHRERVWLLAVGVAYHLRAFAQNSGRGLTACGACFVACWIGAVV